LLQQSFFLLICSAGGSCFKVGVVQAEGRRIEGGTHFGFFDRERSGGFWWILKQNVWGQSAY